MKIVALGIVVMIFLIVRSLVRLYATSIKGPREKFRQRVTELKDAGESLETAFSIAIEEFSGKLTIEDFASDALDMGMWPIESLILVLSKATLGKNPRERTSEILGTIASNMDLSDVKGERLIAPLTALGCDSAEIGEMIFSFTDTSFEDVLSLLKLRENPSALAEFKRIIEDDPPWRPEQDPNPSSECDRVEEG